MRKIKITKLEELNGVDSKNYFIGCSSKEGSVISIIRKDGKIPVASLSQATPKKTLINSLKAYGFNVEIKKEEKVAKVKESVETYNVVIGGQNKKLTLDQIKKLEKVLGEEIEIKELKKKCEVSINGVTKWLTEEECKAFNEVINGAGKEEKSVEHKKSTDIQRLSEIELLIKNGKATKEDIVEFFSLQGAKVEIIDLSKGDAELEEKLCKEKAEAEAELKELTLLVSTGKATVEQIKRFFQIKKVKVLDFNYEL